MALHFSSIGFHYGRKHPVFTQLNLLIAAPATVLLGPNGAGKSTLLSLAAAYLTPQQGHVSWMDIRPLTHRARKEYLRAVAWLPQDVAAVPGLTVREQVAYGGWLKGMSRSSAWDAAAQALARVQLSDLAGTPSHRLSGGQRRRMGIASALAHNSQLILLDEPSAGLDPTQRRVLRGILAELRDHMQVIVSTHQTEDLVGTYSEVIVLDHGSVLFQGTSQEFHDLADGSPTDARERAEAAYARLVGQEA